jgi:hemolysin D
LNKDIGFISPDQAVSVKVTAYPFTQYGDLTGEIEWVASDAVIDKDLGPSYPIRVSVDHYNLPNIINGRQGVITPGMTVAADVKVGRRRVIEYFLAPIMRYKDQSLREM